MNIPTSIHKLEVQILLHIHHRSARDPKTETWMINYRFFIQHLVLRYQELSYTLMTRVFRFGDFLSSSGRNFQLQHACWTSVAIDTRDSFSNSGINSENENNN